MRETYMTPGDTSLSSRRIFAFGTHPDAIEVDQHPTQSAALSNNGFRIVMDELLVGNNLEEIACRTNIDGDAYSRVPVGATPDDIAKCATAQDVLPSTCTGQYATCICQLDTGCTVGTTMIPKGAPVGVDDKNQDGAADDTHLIAGAVGIRCGTINVPIDVNMSYWNPSGNQQPPAMGGFEALGPAIVLIPERGLPSNLDCSLVFGDEVVDKQNVRVCANPSGDPEVDCTPGDTSAVKFKTEPMNFQSVTVTPGMTGVSRTDAVVFVSNTTLDAAAINGITVTAGGTPFTAFTVVLTMGKVLTLTPTGTGFPPNAAIVVTLTAAITDGFAQPLPTPLAVNFMTGP